MRIALVGYGRMGRTVEAVAGRAGDEVVARIDEGDRIDGEALRGAEVALEFTTPGSALPNVRRLADAGVDMVVGTTGWYDRLDEARRAVEQHGVGMVWSSNFSLGVQLFFRVARHVGELVDALAEYDVHLSEAHHRHKVDHPSGTARRLADVLVGSLARKHRWEEGPAEGRPDPEALWISSVRAGEIPGTHVIGIEGPDDRIELKHEARGREGFARGALEAARWIRGRTGLHTLDEMLTERFGATRG